MTDPAMRAPRPIIAYCLSSISYFSSSQMANCMGAFHRFKLPTPFAFPIATYYLCATDVLLEDRSKLASG
jgi:hypothetical protein